jgi:DNA-binding NarL/FixJ family response regulator
MRVAIVSPNVALRVGLRGLLSSNNAELIIAGEAANLDDLDLLAPDADVIVLASVAREEVRELGLLSGPALLLLTDTSENAQTLIRARRVWGVLPLSAGEDELIAAVRALGEGLFVGAPMLINDLLIHPATVEAVDATPLSEPLTGREIEVLQMIALGLANKQIAAELSISEHTVKFHLSSIYTKLGASSRTEAVRLGTRRGLITL